VLDPNADAPPEALSRRGVDLPAPLLGRPGRARPGRRRGDPREQGGPGRLSGGYADLWGRRRADGHLPPRPRRGGGEHGVERARTVHDPRLDGRSLLAGYARRPAAADPAARVVPRRPVLVPRLLERQR